MGNVKMDQCLPRLTTPQDQRLRWVSDLVCVLEHAGTENAVGLGYDWASWLRFQAARQRPDKITAVLGAAAPCLPTNSPTFSTAFATVPNFPHLAYQVFLGETPDAGAEPDVDIRRTLRATLRSRTVRLQFYVREHEIESWAFFRDQCNYTIPQPVLSILADRVADWAKGLKLLGMRTSFRT
ncbi:hypothetical protein FOMPIDRAFT_87395 [Fomitopsis schrenkii]|uniref:Uncharacterized protein n=1 Tax=Fomitopsis schrenkii TaxID=2126942 RepID=S8FN70_FOMSC|nr:hypothetical protein FOMPIDRAFT_87395 [Fomitopsis schrenkii]